MYYTIHKFAEKLNKTPQTLHGKRANKMKKVIKELEDENL